MRCSKELVAVMITMQDVYPREEWNFVYGIVSAPSLWGWCSICLSFAFMLPAVVVIDARLVVVRVCLLTCLRALARRLELLRVVHPKF